MWEFLAKPLSYFVTYLSDITISAAWHYPLWTYGLSIWIEFHQQITFPRVLADRSVSELLTLSARV